MKIDPENRRASLSVGEFSTATPYATPAFGGTSAVWRAQLGTHWHQRIQRRSEELAEGFKSEVALSGSIKWRNWTLRLSGRIDQAKVGKNRRTVHLREIKTLSESLPISIPRLLERYRSYPIQLLAYRELVLRDDQQATLWRDKGDPRPLCAESFCLELLLIEIGSGLSQSLELDRSHDALLSEQLDSVTDQFEAQRERLLRLRSLSVRPAYERPRAGQEDIQERLSKAFKSSKLALLEAPTGYGKTGVAWEFAGRQLASGDCDRILYLTSKATGQIEATSRLRRLLASSSSKEQPQGRAEEATATFWQIRNKQEHCIHAEFRCSSLSCPYLVDLAQKWQNAGLQRLYMLAHEEVDLETLKAEGRATGICPYEITRAALKHRDIWIADYNYLFSPKAAGLIDEQEHFDPSRTLLLIDEAHNLPARVQSAHSHAFSAFATYSALEDLEAKQASHRLCESLKSFANLLAQAGASASPPRAGDSIFPTEVFRRPTQLRSSQPEPSELLEADFRHQLSKAASMLSSEPLPYDEIETATSELLFSIASANEALADDSLEHQLWIARSGDLRLECIDAARFISTRILAYRKALFLSATLSPLDFYLDEIGIEQPPSAGVPSASSAPRAEPRQAESSASASHQLIRPPAKWRDQAYDLAVDLRVDTRYRSRSRHLATTAKAIAQAAARSSPTVAFFPSYAYAQQVFEVLSQQHPQFRTTLQPKGLGSLSEQTSYLEMSIALEDILLLILGSSFAEGIDALGGRIRVATIVSPALPEANFIQDTRRRRHESLGRDGFERAYLHPGILKVNQALGRLARAPGHRVKALLHCQRFASRRYRKLLDPLYRTNTYIQSDNELEDWLNA